MVQDPERNPLSLTIWGGGTLMGEVRATLATLTGNPDSSGWWPIYPVRQESYVCGDVQVRIERPTGASTMMVTGSTHSYHS